VFEIGEEEVLVLIQKSKTTLKQDEYISKE
jgi:hypothetical protein